MIISKPADTVSPTLHITIDDDLISAGDIEGHIVPRAPPGPASRRRDFSSFLIINFIYNKQLNLHDLEKKIKTSHQNNYTHRHLCRYHH